MKLSLSALTLSAVVATSAQAQGLSYPVTRKVDQVDTYHGTTVADPYRWLEDDNSAETKAWVVQQNEVTDKFLAAMPQRLPTRRIYTELYNYERFGIPFHEGGRYFWSRNDGLQQQSVLYTAKTLKDEPRVALDPNAMSKDGTVALSGVVPSRDGKLLAYGVAGAGSDWQTWKVRDLATGQDRDDKIEWVKFSSATWTADGQGFFYARYDAPKEGEALKGANYYQKLYYHRLGTPQSDDVLVAENRDDKEWGFGTEVSDDGQLLLISVWKSAGRKNGLMLLPLQDGAFQAAAQAQTLTLDFDATYDPVAIAQAYERGGARAISVLTEPTFFDGALEHLEAVGGRLGVGRAGLELDLRDQQHARQPRPARDLGGNFQNPARGHEQREQQHDADGHQRRREQRQADGEHVHQQHDRPDEERGGFELHQRDKQQQQRDRWEEVHPPDRGEIGLEPLLHDGEDRVQHRKEQREAERPVEQVVGEE